MRRFIFFFLIFVAGLSLGLFYHHSWRRKIEDEAKRSLSYKGEVSFFQLLNEHRRGLGLNEIKYDERFCKHAYERAEEIVDDFSHRKWNSLKQFKVCPECKEVGENLARFFYSPENLLELWLASPKHKEILEDRVFRFGCLGIHEHNSFFYASLQVGG